MLGWLGIALVVAAAAAMWWLDRRLTRRRLERFRDRDWNLARWEAYDSTCRRFAMAGHDPAVLRRPDVPDPRHPERPVRDTRPDAA